MSVASVMKSFTKIIDKLDRIALNEDQRANDIQVSITNQLTMMADAENEANMARSIADNLRKLMG